MTFDEDPADNRSELDLCIKEIETLQADLEGYRQVDGKNQSLRVENIKLTAENEALKKHTIDGEHVSLKYHEEEVKKLQQAIESTHRNYDVADAAGYMASSLLIDGKRRLAEENKKLRKKDDWKTKKWFDEREKFIAEAERLTRALEMEKTRVHTQQCTNLYNEGFFNNSAIEYACICGGEDGMVTLGELQENKITDAILVLKGYCRCQPDYRIDTSVGQKYESCSACLMIKKLEKK